MSSKTPTWVDELPVARIMSTRPPALSVQVHVFLKEILIIFLFQQVAVSFLSLFVFDITLNTSMIARYVTCNCVCPIYTKWAYLASSFVVLFDITRCY